MAVSPQVLRGSLATFWLASEALFDKLSGESLVWLNTTLFWACPASECSGEGSCLQPCALSGDEKLEPFLGAEDLTPRLYLVFCFWWVGQISWCLRWDLQCWRAAPRYCSQYFFFLFLWIFYVADNLVCTCFLPVLSRAVLSHGVVTGLRFHLVFLMIPKLLITCQLTFWAPECDFSLIWMFFPCWAWGAFRAGLGPELCSSKCRAAGT